MPKHPRLPRPPRVVKKSRREVLRHFRPPGALPGPRERQKTIQDEEPAPAKGSRPLGVDVVKKSGRRGSGSLGLD
eukprot:1097812-Pyramimonas_sp.AAC.1